ncbi:MAG: hypothetical protein M1837_001420 [Sclerophora amabilis]|nr:MAG: hypothetical protein M1837_001420 [Sclerophora amabilis]
MPRKRIPTANEYLQEILAGGMMVDKSSVFWTGFPRGSIPLGYHQARNWAKNYPATRHNWIVYDKSLPFEKYLEMVAGPKYPADTSEEDQLRIDRLSKAFAMASSHVVYVASPDGAQPRANSTWNIWEYPTLTRNPSVLEIVQVSLPSGATRVMWRKEDGIVGEEAPP